MMPQSYWEALGGFCGIARDEKWQVHVVKTHRCVCDRRVCSEDPVVCC